MSGLALSAEDVHPNRWRILALLSLAELLGMSLWFAASAVSVQLAVRWAVPNSAVSWFTTIVQLGFVVGTAAVALLNLADVIPSKWLFALSALVGAGANAALIVAPSFAIALLLRFVTGCALAGVYPPAMKMVSTWFRLRRGLAIGTVVGALTIGKATPYLVHALPGAGVHSVVLAASAGAVLAAILVAVGYVEGPYPFPPRPFSWTLGAAVFSSRRWRLATGGYLGHMFELYSFWTWIPLFIAASITARGGVAGSEASLIAFGTIAIGGLGCIWGGLSADKHGRERLVMMSLAASGSCSIIIPVVYGKSVLLLTLLAWTWGFFVIADSAQFSALVTESVPSHAVGTALAIQTSLGFLLTMVSIQLVPPIVAEVGWRWAFPVLALGPVFGIGAIRRLVTFRADPDLS